MIRAFMKTVALGICLMLPLAATAAGKELYTVGGAPLGGTYYPAAVGLAELITKYVPDAEGRVEVTGGTVQNPVLMEQGELQLGLANADMAYFALKGMPPFKSEMPSLRGLFIGLAPGTVQYTVMEESGIKSIADLKGKRVAVGPQGNSSGLLFVKVLEFYGMKASDVTMSFLSFSDGVNELLDGHVDMAIVQAGLPAPGLQEAFAGPKKIAIMSFPVEDRDRFLTEHPYYIPMDITPKHYEQLSENVITFATSNMVMVREDVPEQKVYEITAAVFDHLEEFYKAHPTIRNVTLEDGAKTPIPLHPGAARYFTEKGVMPR